MTLGHHVSPRSAFPRPTRNKKPSYVNKCVLERDVPGVSSEIHPLAVLMIMPPQRVFPPIDLLFAGKTCRSFSRIRDVSLAFPMPTEVFPASVAAPFFPDPLEEWVGSVAA